LPNLNVISALSPQAILPVSDVSDRLPGVDWRIPWPLTSLRLRRLASVMASADIYI